MSFALIHTRVEHYTRRVLNMFYTRQASYVLSMRAQAMEDTLKRYASHRKTQKIRSKEKLKKTNVVLSAISHTRTRLRNFSTSGNNGLQPLWALLLYGAQGSNIL